jgi:hypothetical protein
VKRDPGNGHARAECVLVYLDPEGTVRLRDGSTAVLAEGVVLEVTGMRPLCEACWAETAVVFAFDLGSGTFLGPQCSTSRSSRLVELRVS